MEGLSVRMLGGFAVAVDGDPVPPGAWRGRRGADLVKLLALAPGHRLPRERVIEALWPRLDPAAGAANLHKAAHHARRALGDPEALVVRGGLVALAPSAAVVTDVERFEAGGDPERYGGELLPDDPYEEWTLVARDRLAERHREALRAAGRHAELARADPGDEAAALACAHDLAGEGRRHDAAACLARLRAALAEDGRVPGPEAQALERELARGPALVAARQSAAAPLVGRGGELEAARAALARAGAGAGGGLLVTGPAGIGKTRLAEELLARAAEEGRSTLRGSAREGVVPYAPVVEALGPLARQRPDLLDGLTPAARAELGRLGLAGPDPPPAPEGPPERGRIVTAVGQALAAVARERGAVILFDDLDAADAGTLRLAGYLARAARPQRLLVVLAFRPPAPGTPLAELRGALLEARVATELELGPLAPAEAAALVARAAPPGRGAAAAPAIWRAAEGNPLVTEALAAALGPAGEPEPPPDLLAAIEARLAPLPAEERATLGRLAAVGGHLAPDEVAALAGGDGVAERVVAAGLAAGVLVETPDGRGYRVAHAVAHEALTRHMGPQARRSAHLAAARRLEEAGAAPARIADQLLAAGRPGAAVPWLAAAARAAVAVAAWDEARVALERALPHAGTAQRRELLTMRADALLAQGDSGAAAAYAEALSASGTRRRVELRVRQAQALLMVEDVAGASAVLADLRPRGATQRTRVLLARGTVAWFRDDAEGARAAAEEARPLAAAAGLAHELQEAVALSTAVAASAGDWVGRVRLDIAEALALPERAGAVFDSHVCVTEYLLAAGGPYQELAVAAASLQELAARSGARRAEAFAATVRGESELLAGDADAAHAHLAHALALAERVGTSCGQSIARIRLAEAAIAAGRPQEAPALLQAALASARWSVLAKHLLFLTYESAVRAAPDPAAALALVGELDGLSAVPPGCAFCATGFHVAAAEACARAGAPDRGAAHLEGARRLSGLWRGEPWAPALDEAQGRLELAAGEPERGAPLLARAADGYARAGKPLHSARARTAA